MLRCELSHFSNHNAIEKKLTNEEFNTTNNKRAICLIGGGHSHIAVIKQFGIHPIPGASLTLISPDALTPYSGMIPGLIAGHYAFKDCHIDLMKLCRWAGAQFVSGQVQAMDLQTKQVVCGQHPPVHYDLLSINTGSQPALHQIHGATEYGHPVKPIKNFIQGWQSWLESARNSLRPQRVVVIGGGAAGIEILLAMHYKMSRRYSKRSDFTLVCADQQILSTHNQQVRNFFDQHLQSSGITIIRGKRVIAIDRQQLLLDDQTTLHYNFAAWCIHATAPPWLKESGIQCDEKSFVLVDQYLRSISHPEIFTSGDAASFTPAPLPKAGVYAVRQGPILAKNIAALIKNQPLSPYKLQRRYLSLLTTGDRYAVASWGSFFAQGKWVWYWKNWIDRSFMARYQSSLSDDNT